jgi:hypothetical protein
VLKANIPLPTKFILEKLCNIPSNEYFFGGTTKVENDISKAQIGDFLNTFSMLVN